MSVHLIFDDFVVNDRTNSLVLSFAPRLRVILKAACAHLEHLCLCHMTIVLCLLQPLAKVESAASDCGAPLTLMKTSFLFSQIE